MYINITETFAVKFPSVCLWNVTSTTLYRVCISHNSKMERLFVTLFSFVSLVQLILESNSYKLQLAVCINSGPYISIGLFKKFEGVDLSEVFL